MRNLALVLLLALAAAPAPAVDDAARAELDAVRSLHRGGQLAEARDRARALWSRAGAGGDEEFALEVLQEMVDIAVKGGGEDAVDLALQLARRTAATGDRTRAATATSRLAQAYHRAGDFESARREAERAVALHDVAGSPEAARALSFKILANLYVDRDLLEEASAVFERVLPIDAAGDPVTYAKTLYNYGRLIGEGADFERAREVYAKCLEVLGNAAPQHPLVAWAHNGLAGTLLQLDEYAAARDEYEAALASLPPGDPLALSCRNNLALVQSALGRHERAEEILREVCAAQIEEEGEDGLTVASTRMNLADVLLAAGRADEARALLERTLAVRKARLGEQHVQTTASLERLGQVDLERGQVDLAVRELTRLVEIRRRGTQSVFLGSALLQLARAETEAARFGKARAAATEALGIFERTVGPANPRVAEACEAIARAEAGAGNDAAALAAALRSETVARAHAELTIDLLPEGEAVRFADVRGGGLDQAHRFRLGARPDPAADARVFDALVRSRALVLDTLRRRRAAASDPGLLRELRAASRELAQRLVAGPGEGVAEAAHRARIDAAVERRDRAERAIARRAAGSGSGPEIGGDAALAAIPPRAGLVAFVRLRADGRAPARYAAWVATAGARPQLVDLDDAARVDAAVAAWRASVERGAADAGPEAARACRAAGAALRASVWDKVAPRVSGADTVILVPDGSLHLVNFAALPAAGDAWLVETGPCFHQLSAERDLLRPWPDRPVNGALFVGDVAYGEGTRPAGRLPRFEPLPGTREEVRALRAAWPAAELGAPVVLAGVEATESAVIARAKGREVVHLATHGFFLDGAPDAARPGTRGIGAVVRTPAGGGRRWPLSGLALAGANGREGPDDGVLTAEEIATSDLAGTRWAVLSACDTGLGEIRRGEGVLGLRRAFELAGVHTLLLSLWDVDDEATRDWMQHVYDAHWSRGLATAQAVREASREMLAKQRSKSGHAHPYTWGPFVAVGDWQ